MQQKGERAQKKRESFQSHYDRHPEYHLERKQGRRKEMARWIHSLKIGKACCVCGESHPATLVYHHRSPSEKLFRISGAMSRGMGKEAILREIEKCDILCANCHQKLHWDERASERE